jgi:hypothetical protein
MINNTMIVIRATYECELMFLLTHSNDEQATISHETDTGELRALEKKTRGPVHS